MMPNDSDILRACLTLCGLGVVRFAEIAGVSKTQAEMMTLGVCEIPEEAWEKLDAGLGVVEQVRRSARAGTEGR